MIKSVQELFEKQYENFQGRKSLVNDKFKKPNWSANLTFIDDNPKNKAPKK